MTIIKRFSQNAAFCALLLCFNPASADNLQDASKLFKHGQQQQALEKVNSILSAHPKDAQARFLKGLILTELGKTADAIQVFTELTKDYPELPEPYNNIAVLYAGQGQYEKAKIALEMAIRTHPSYATAHENLGDIYAKMASQAYDRALQLDKSNTSTLTKLELIKDLFGDRHNASASHKVISIPKPVIIAAAQPKKVTLKTPVIKQVKTAPSAQAAKTVLKTAKDWAAAWSAKDINKYLTFYAKEFKTPHNMSRRAWEAQRHSRISKPKSIQVKIQDATVKLIDKTHARIVFKQIYRASHLHSTARKTLELIQHNGKWLITLERSGR
ncbi:MAG: tetratricopeptide repeat protein [Gallionellaceae bacterium]